MPVINGEASYEMLLDLTLPEKPRAMFWLCMMNGAAGHTYGANGIWQVNRKGQPHGPSPTPGSTGYGSISWDEAMHLAGGCQIAAGKRWLDKLPWWTFQPHFTWADWTEAPKPEPGCAPITPGSLEWSHVNPCGIGCTNGQRVFYMLQDRSVVFHQLKPDCTYHLTHFDPVEGNEKDGGTLIADRKGDISLAAPGHEHDWVVLIEPVTESR
jgi:hypothetical protein